jgi:uncharacterized coiled-coil protein SlyX
MTDYTANPIETADLSSNHPVLTQLKKRIEELEMNITTQSSFIADYKKSLEQQFDRTHKQQLECQSVLEILLENQDITIDDAQLIADCFDYVSLSKTVQIEFNITATATVQIPFGADPDDVASSVFVQSVDFYTDYADTEILDHDFFTDDYNVVS